MDEYRQVHLLICPLKQYTKYHLEDVDLAANLKRLHHVPFRGLQHWAIQVGEHHDSFIFEVTSNDNKDGLEEAEARYRRISKKEWWENHYYNQHQVQDRFLGVTSTSDEGIDRLGQLIWDHIYHQKYRTTSTNCQTFSAILQAIIINNSQLEPWDRAKLGQLPSPLNPMVTIHGKVKRVVQLATLSKRQDTTSAIPHRPGRRWLEALHDHTEQQGTNIETAEHLQDSLRTTNKKRQDERRMTRCRRLSFGILPCGTSEEHDDETEVRNEKAGNGSRVGDNRREPNSTSTTPDLRNSTNSSSALLRA